jgi:hypothetical protein
MARGGGKGGSQAEVTRYRMSMHVGVCAYRRGIELLRLYVGDKEAWSGQKRNQEQFEINQPELFGGLRKEGGVGGLISWLPGAQNQILPENISGRIDSDPTEVIGFRGLVSLFFSGVGNAGGFYWCANNPYLKPLKVRVRGIPQGLNPALAMIDLPNDSQERSQKAANPAHIIYESMINRSWGMGASPSGIDIGSFEKAAQTLFTENFGLALLWTRQTEIENFINEVLDHIQAKMFMHPFTGLHTIKLLRDDYDIEDLDELNPDNANLMNYKRKMWGETANEVVVTYTDAETENEFTVTAQDPAAIAIQGGNVISTSRNYYGVRDQALALRLAERDVSMVAAPIATCEAEVDRSSWNKVPGDVIKVTWPEHGISQVVFRIEDVNYGSDKNSKIRLVLMEDIFAFDKSAYLSEGASKWISPNQPPETMTRFAIQTIPAFLTSRVLGLNSPADLNYPECMIGITAGRNFSGDVSYELKTRSVGVSGDPIVISLGERTHCPTGTLVASLSQQASSTIALSGGYLGRRPRVDDFVFFVGTSENTSEIALVVSVTGNAFTVWRGVLDTTPKAWGIGTRYWIVGDDVNFVDQSVRSDGEEASYKMLNRTPLGLFDETLANFEDYTATDRPHLPNRPANVFVNGTGFGVHDATDQEEFNVSWNRRNRTVEVLQVFPWWDGDMTPEEGQTTTVRLLRNDNSVIDEFPDIEGTSLLLSYLDFDGETSGKIEVVSFKDGQESLQGHRISLINIMEP